MNNVVNEPGYDPRYHGSIEVYRQLKEFPKFLGMTWRHLNLPNPTPVQVDIAKYLQDDSRKRIVIEAFRGVGKSWVTSAFVCWLLYMNPQLNILVVSASKTRSDDFTTFTQRLIQEIPFLAFLKPKQGQRNSKVSFDVGPANASHAPSVKSLGITGQLAGSRADVLISDDVEVPGNSATVMMRDKLSEAIKEYDAVLKPGGRIIYLGTPQTESSIYNLLPSRGYELRIWPALYPTEDRRGMYGNKLAPKIADELDRGIGEVGKSTDPQRFSDIDLEERRLSYGNSGFSLQFMLDTSLSDAEKYPLKLSDLIVMNTNNTKGPEMPIWSAGSDTLIPNLPNVGMEGDMYYGPMRDPDRRWSPYTGAVMAIDPSGRGGDELGYAVVKFLNGYLYVTRAGGIQGGYTEKVLEELANIAKEEEVKRIIIESNFGDGMFTQLLKPVLGRVYPCTTEEVRHNTQKEARIIDTLEPVMNQHKLVINEKVIKSDYDTIQHYPAEMQMAYSLFYQMTRLTRDRGAIRHDDRLDALAIAVAFWVERMSADAEKLKESKREETLQKELRGFVEGARGGSSFVFGIESGGYDGGSII